MMSLTLRFGYDNVTACGNCGSEHIRRVQAEFGTADGDVVTMYSVVCPVCGWGVVTQLEIESPHSSRGESTPQGNAG